MFWVVSNVFSNVRACKNVCNRLHFACGTKIKISLADGSEAGEMLYDYIYGTDICYYKLNSIRKLTMSPIPYASGLTAEPLNTEAVLRLLFGIFNYRKNSVHRLYLC